jgi:glyoxylase-like metal-dependent hydrolase (beta-lactamase superfamily II)
MRRTAVFVLALSLLVPAALLAQDFDAVEIRTVQVSDSIYMLVGEGGNIGVSVGEDGVFIIDDQFAPLTDKIKSAIAQIAGQPVQFVINTHYHYDHTDGNENFGGEGAIIVAHENSRARMATDQVLEAFEYLQKAYSAEGLPKITFTESMRFHYNGQTIDVFHTPGAHTDGDAIIWFLEANVVHTGHVFVRYFPPFIDQPSGGSISGIIAAVERIAEMADEKTKFIPGHGEVSSKQDLARIIHE